MKRKFLSCFLILCVILSLYSVSCAAYESVAQTEYNGHTYRVFDVPLSWTEARDYCNKMGGYLVTVTSEEEQKIVEELISTGKKNQYWLGGTDSGSEGRWKWITGEDWKYTNWDNRQPDNGSGYENYLQIYKKPNPRVPDSKEYKWNDITENNVFNSYELNYFDKKYIGFICESEESKSSFGSFVSTWAKDVVEEAYSSGFVPEKLVGEKLNEKVTRAEFAAIAVSLYESLSGGEYTNVPAVNPFDDISDSLYKDEILKAYSLNITVGTSDNTFEPDLNITREQMATMLTRTYKKAEFEDWTIENDSQYALDYSGVKLFADDSDISSYAKEAVYFMAKWNIIQGVNENVFAPKGNAEQDEAYGYATREQAIVIAQRTASALKNAYPMTTR